MPTPKIKEFPHPASAKERVLAALTHYEETLYALTLREYEDLQEALEEGDDLKDPIVLKEALEELQ